MKVVTSTPSRPANPKRCDGLIVQLRRSQTRKQALATARKVVSRLSGKWQVNLINHADRLYEALRTKPKTQPTVRQAFDMVRDLMEDPEVEMAEIGAIVPGADPDLRQVLTEAEMKLLPKGGGGGGDLPCSSDPEWALHATRIPEAWDLPPNGGAKFGKDIVVAHPDTGYTLHPEFIHGNRVLTAKGFDFESDDTDPADPLKGQAPSHGTSTGSVIMSTTGKQIPANHAFVSGVAPRAKLIPIRVSTGVVHLSFRKVTKAIYHAIDTNAHVISMSLGGPFFSRALQVAVDSAIEKGIVVIAAAGNKWPFVVYPAKLDEVIAVAASNCNRKPWSGSARGSKVDFTAPGESVWRAKTKKSNSGQFIVARSDGTSYATAMTAGACALWLAFHGRNNLITKYGKANLSAAFRHCVSTTVDTPPGWKKSKYGAGIIDVKALLSLPLPAESTVSGAAPSPKSVSDLDEVLDYLAGAKKGNARAILAKMFNCKPADLRRELKGYREELCYQLATNPELRSTIIAKSMAKKATGISSKTLAKPTLLGGRVSRGLQKRLEM
ncbi:MAG: S8 family serine peptidase [Xanthomonadales bacterium]|nr:S8 family serine peptidase [Xanthomonadales bacterium]